MRYVHASKRLAPVALACALVASLLAPSADAVPVYSGGPTHYVETSRGEIAVSVVLPDDFDPAKTYPTILEIAGYENGSASADGRTMLGQSRDAFCEASGQDPADCSYPDPPLAYDSHHDTSAFRYEDGYVVVHASLPGTGCSSGEFGLYSFSDAKAGAELIDEWIVDQDWSNGKVGLLGHSYGGMTGFLVAAHQPEHLEAMTISGLVDDVYRGITFPGGVFNTLFPPLWYLGIRNAYDAAGGSGQGIVRNADNPNGPRCAENTAGHTRSVEDDPIVQGVTGSQTDNGFWRSHSLIGYVDLIDVPIHIAGTFQDEQTGARGFPHLWEHIPDGVPKRLVIGNGDHATNVDAYEMWADRKAWMDHWMRDVPADPSWGWTDADGNVRETSVRTLFEIHPDAHGDLVSNGHLDTASFPVEGTSFTDHYLCAGRAMTTDPASCGAGSDVYVSGSRRQSWNYQAGPSAGPPVTTADAPDQLMFRGPVVKDGEAWAIDGPIVANLYLSTTGNDTDLFVQIADEDTETGTITYLQRGLLKASRRAIDTDDCAQTGASVDCSDYTDVDPDRPGFLYRPWRPHDGSDNLSSGTPYELLVEVWPVAHVFRPLHRPVVVVTAPPAVDSDYSYAVPTSQPAGLNTLHYADPDHPSKITLPVVAASSITGLGETGPGCGDYWQVRCAG